MTMSIVLPNVDERQDAYEKASEVLPDHSAAFVALLQTLPLDKAMLRQLENIVTDWVSAQDHAAFDMGYMMGMASAAHPVMGLN
jgi:hypothetical protein